MPGQFKHLAPLLAARPENRVVFLTRRRDIELPGVVRASYAEPANPGANTHQYVKRYEAAVRYGQQVVRGIASLRHKGFEPDVIIAHPGWGEALFLKDACPGARVINFCEFYYQGRGLDVGFDPEDPAGIDDLCRARARTAHLLSSLESCDAAVSPTRWQKSVHPVAFHDKIELIFDGIDTDLVRPIADASFTLPNGRSVRRGDKVVTYIARNLEPYRGFRPFMRAIPGIQRLQPDAEIVIVGGDDVSYGKKPRDFANWREAMLAEVVLDRSRVHFTGRIPYDQYLRLLSVSDAHVYLTYPFVLSWSCVEAMAAGGLVIGSDTPPVREVIEHGVNGLLVNFFDSAGIAAQVGAALADPARFAPLRDEARRTVEAHYALKHCLPKWSSLIDRLLEGRDAGAACA
jgi:glycosyltransferase involved in cell wall biosynthesis